jgi:hypothetical protein
MDHIRFCYSLSVNMHIMICILFMLGAANSAHSSKISLISDMVSISSLYQANQIKVISQVLTLWIETADGVENYIFCKRISWFSNRPTIVFPRYLDASNVPR